MKYQKNLLHTHIKQKDKDISVVGETSTSIDKMIQKVEKIEKDEIVELKKLKKKETNKIENNNSIEINKFKIKTKQWTWFLQKWINKYFFDVIGKIDDEETKNIYKT